MKLSLIVAMAGNRVIGRDNELPWHLPADLRRFKALTMGHHLLVGRKTYESIGRPLPGRTMLVVSRSEPELPEEIQVCGSIEDAIEFARNADEEELFIAGGAEIYRQTIDLADCLYVTEVDLEIEGDALFPEISPGLWRETGREAGEVDEKNRFPHAFVDYKRVVH